jgi:hypothetical protein
MYRFPGGGTKKRFVTFIVLVLFALTVCWLGFRGSQPRLAGDYEECVDQVLADPASSDDRPASTAACNARFAGRRKAGGGYTYYDFMQNRNFDIAGPNPTADERKQIDREYMGFLDAQRREALSDELARQQNQRLQAEIESTRQPVGPPMILAPKNLSASAGKPPVDRSKSARCKDRSLTCSWQKLTAVVKNAFASSSGTKR